MTDYNCEDYSLLLTTKVVTTENCEKMMSAFDHDVVNDLPPFRGPTPSINIQTINEDYGNPVIFKIQEEQCNIGEDVHDVHFSEDDNNGDDMQIIEKILHSPTDPRGKFLRGLQLSASECIMLDLLPYLKSIPRRKRSKYGKRRNDQSDAERSEITKSRNREHARATRDRRKVFIRILEKSLTSTNRHLNSSVIDYLEKNQYDYQRIVAKQAASTTINVDCKTTFLEKNQPLQETKVNQPIHEAKRNANKSSTSTTSVILTPTTTAATTTDYSSPGLSPSLFSHIFDLDIKHDIDVDILSAYGYNDADFPFGDIDFDYRNHTIVNEDELTTISI